MDQEEDSFPPEWTLPELPKPSAPSLSTAEFEEIFGGSDDENSFPLSLSGLQEDHDKLNMDLPRTRELLLSSIEESLEMKPPSSLDSESLLSPDNLKKDADIMTESTTSEELEFEKNLAKLKKEPDVDTTMETLPVKDKEEAMDIDVESGNEMTTRRSKRLRQKDNEDEYLEKKIKHELPDKSSNEEEKNEQTDNTGPDGEETQDSDSNGEEYSSDDEDSDDPDKLWCICQQPHDDRFMICCDRCGEWYHGDCVGISVAEGKRMEKSGKEYICIKCNDHETSTKVEREKNRTMRQNRREAIRAKQMAELLEKRQSQSSTGTTDRTSTKSKKMLKGVTSKTCTGPGCDKLATSPSLYCSEDCIKKHVEFSLKKLEVRGLSRGSTVPGEFAKGSGGITVVEPRTKKIMTGLSAPSEKNLLPWLKAHPSYRVLIPSERVVTPGKKSSKKFKEEEKSDSDTQSTKPHLNDDSTRQHAKKAFKQVLLTRSQMLPDDEKVSEEELSKLADDIELKLYNVHNQEVNQKYRTKCRSLLFNLKDSKNQGLFKKIVVGDISTRQLVRMSPEQLASEELAEWREKTIKKELEMITEVAKEAVEMSSSSVVRKMTYKGEVEIERPTDTLPEMPVKSEEEVSSTTTDETVLNNKDTSTVLPPPSSLSSVVKESSQTMESSVLSLLTDTTNKHGSHIFDTNCAICTGKKQSTNKQEDHVKTKEKDITKLNVSSPDSQSHDHIEHIVTSPDSLSQPYSIVPTTSLQPIWNGNISMHSMKTFSIVAYPVSGITEGLGEILPQTLQIVGRIAHVQVWDYLDKLKMSSSKEILVLRFDKIEDDTSGYLEMMDYLIQKHRYGVIQCNGFGHLKDMYFIPLQYDDPVPAQILPFDGPGLPFNRQDTFLCVITRSKHTDNLTDTPRKRKYSGRVHFGSSPEGLTPPVEKKPVQFEAFNTPPVKVSFYGDSKDFTTKTSASSSIESNVEKTTSALEKVTGLSQSGIKSILSTLSDEKLQELASAMSTIQPQEQPSTVATNVTTQKNLEATDADIVDNKLRPTLDERLSATFGLQSKYPATDHQPTHPTSSPTTITPHEGTSNVPLPPISRSQIGPPSSYSSMPSSDTHGSLLPSDESYRRQEQSYPGMSPSYYARPDSSYNEQRPPYNMNRPNEDQYYNRSSNEHYDQPPPSYREDYHDNRYWRERDPSGYRRHERYSTHDRYERRHDYHRRDVHHSSHHRTSRWSNDT